MPSAVRFLLSKCRHPEAARSDDELKAVNGALIRAFVALAQAQGARPIVVLLPAPGAFGDDHQSVAREVLRATQVEHLDLTSCVRQVPPAERFVAFHYSPRANAAVAMCVRDVLAGFPEILSGDR